MAPGRSVVRTVGLTCLLVLISLGGGVLHAQDRGAPRFGPAPAVDTVAAEPSDAGRLWSVAAPPFDRFETRYGMTADSAWATHLRRGLLRLPDCSAALVSAEGLALTSAACVRPFVEEEEGAVVASDRGAERSLQGLHADRLLDAVEVTSRVKAAQRDTAVQQAVATVQRRLQSEVAANRRVEVHPAAGGGPYTAYTYRRYDDVRVAFLPDRRVSDLGGLDAAMTYPRHALDVALLRVYTAEDTPLSPDHFFETPAQGLRPGDPVFAVGHAQSTRRAESADQGAVRRDLVLPNRRDLLETWTDATRAVHDTDPAEAERALKQTRARLDALQSDYVMTRLRRRDAQLRDTLRQDPTLQRRYGGVLDSLSAIQARKRTLEAEYRAFGFFGREAYTSVTFRRLVQDVRVGDSLSVYVDSSTWSPAVETALLADRLRRLQTLLRSDTAAVRRLLNDRSPADRAAVIVDESRLATAGGASADPSALPPDDPATTLLDVIRPRARSFYDEWAGLTHQERRLTRRLARARQAVQSTPVRPGGPRSPRLTDGRVLGYPYNGTAAPPVTTLYGLYGQSAAFDESGAWALPAAWRQASAQMDRSAPLNLAVSTDPAAGLHGAPLLNQYLEVVGVTLGTNIQGVAGQYLFLPERMRTVGVDLRGLRESLRAVYGADRLVEELYGGGAESAARRR